MDTSTGTVKAPEDLLIMAKPKATKSTKTESGKRVKPELYDGIVARSQIAIMEASHKARDIAPAPEIEDRTRRDRAGFDLRYFLETYFPLTFNLQWSADHLK